MEDPRTDVQHTPSDKILTDPPFYLPEFEASYRYIIDVYEVPPRDIAIFIPCAVRKPYSTSPSHRIMRAIIDKVLQPDSFHLVIFGTCGILPAELETMYPYAHYQYMLGKVKDPSIQEDFLRIETDRVAGYLQKTKDTYKKRIAYCIGPFRRALIQGSELAGVPIDIIMPGKDVINKIMELDCPFQEGSLNMEEYLEEFYKGLVLIRDSLL
jgi:predicted RNA-binding protein